MKRRMLAVLISIVMLFTTVTANATLSAMALEQPHAPLTITADSGDSTITIVKTDEPEIDPVDPGIVTSPGTLSIITGTQSIQRDYNQKATIRVVNNTGAAIEYYLVSDNNYDDIYLNFVKNGSVDEPIVILDGETQEIELSIFAQNTTRTKYNIPVTAYILTNSEPKKDTMSTLTLNVPSVTLNIACSMQNNDEATLIQTYLITNNGEALTDVSVSISGDAGDYTQLNPIVSNFAMSTYDSTTIKAIPDLSKMKKDNITAISGTIVVSSGGKSKEFNLEFDTQGKEITSTTMGQLIALQNNNPYYGLTYVNGSENTSSESNEQGVKYNKSAEYTYGNENDQLKLSLNIAGKPYSGSAYADKTNVSIINDHQLSLTFETIVEKDLFLNLISFMESAAQLSGVSLLDGIDSYLNNNEMYSLKYSLSIEDSNVLSDPDSLYYLTRIANYEFSNIILADPTADELEKASYCTLILAYFVIGTLDFEARVVAQEPDTDFLEDASYELDQIYGDGTDLTGYQMNVNLNDLEDTEFIYFYDVLFDVDFQVTDEYLTDIVDGAVCYLTKEFLMIKRGEDVFLCQEIYLVQDDGKYTRSRMGIGQTFTNIEDKASASTPAAFSLAQARGIVEEPISKTEEEFKQYFDTLNIYLNFFSDTSYKQNQDQTYEALMLLLSHAEKMAGNDSSKKAQLNIVRSYIDLGKLVSDASKTLNDINTFITYANKLGENPFPGNTSKKIEDAMKDCINSMNSVVKKIKNDNYQKAFKELQKYFESLQKEYNDLKKKYGSEQAAAMLLNKKGSQCTNAGKVATDFYLPDYGNSIPVAVASSVADSKFYNEIARFVDEPFGGSGPIAMYVTSRMADGSPFNAGFVDEQFGGYEFIHTLPVLYDISLNGEKVGTTINAGLTEVVFDEIPLDKLKTGQNTLVLQYDTNPGHYKVATDTEITFLYPANMFISYIGSPATLEEIRALPDFAVYSENIYYVGSAIVGESSQIKVNVYNRGSLGGWADIIISDGTNLLYSEENVYIPEFSIYPVEFEWTPIATSSNISVALTNKTIGIPERKTDNNSASKTVAARQREIPVIDTIAPTIIYLDGSCDSAWIVADISDAADIKSVSFTIDDGTPISQNSVSRISDGSIRASVSVPNPSVGSHTIKVIVEYFTTSTSTAFVDDADTVTVQQIDAINFSINTSTVVNPQFRIYDNNGYSSGLISNVSIGNYSLQKTVAMETNVSDYNLLVKCDAGIILVPLDQLDGTTLTLNETTAHEVSFTTGDATITSVTVSSLNDYAFSASYTFYNTSKLLFSNNITEARIRAYYSIANISAYMPNTISVNLDDDQDIDLILYYRLFQFVLPEEYNYYGYIPLDIIATVSPSNTSYLYGDTNYRQGNRTYSYLLTDNYYLSQLANADTVTAWLSLSDTLFKIDLTSYEAPIELNSQGYSKLTFTLNGAGNLEIGTTTLYENNAGMYRGYDLFGNQLTVPKGTYTLLINYKVNGSSTNYLIENLAITGDKAIELPGITTNNPAMVSFDWPQRFENASFSYRLTNYYWSSDVNTTRNELMTIREGQTDVELGMYTYVNSPYSYTNLRVARTVNGVAGENVAVTVGDSFTGSLRRSGSNSINGGSGVYIYLEDMVDSYGNRLSYFDAHGSANTLKGTMTFTNKADSEDMITVNLNSLSNISSGSSIYVTVPNVSGEYYYSLLLSTDISVDPGKDDNQKVAADKAALTWDVIKGANSEQNYLTTNLILPVSGANGSTITWASSDTAIISTTGVVTRPSYSSGNKIVTLTATITSGNVSDTVTFTLAVVAQPYTPPYAPPTTTVPDPEIPLAWLNPYSDVADTDWFYEAVHFVTETDLMNGTSVGKFSPNVTMSRAMLVTVLYRHEGEPAVSGNIPFFDVTSGQWYSDAILWASRNNIVNGYNDQTFGWNDPVTREQAVVILYRYAKMKGLDVSASADLSTYTDMNEISDWALPAMQWAVAEGIIKGRTATTTVPKGTSTRAEVAMIFKRYIEDFLGESDDSE